MRREVVLRHHVDVDVWRDISLTPDEADRISDLLDRCVAQELEFHDEILTW